MTVTDFDLEEADENQECYDWLEIGGQVYCGKHEILPTKSCTSTQRIEFKSDDSETTKGFQARLDVVEPSKKMKDLLLM